jgi:hypothetical protein
MPEISNGITYGSTGSESSARDKDPNLTPTLDTLLALFGITTGVSPVVLRENEARVGEVRDFANPGGPVCSTGTSFAEV